MATEKAYKLDLTKTLLQLDKRNKDLFETFTDEQKKEFSPFIYMKFMASAPDKLANYTLPMTNDAINQNFWDLSSEKELQVKLLSMCGTGDKVYHKWVSSKPASSIGNDLRTFITNVFKLKNWCLNNTEMKLYLSMISEDELVELCGDHGKTTEEVKRIVTDYRKLDL